MRVGRELRLVVYETLAGLFVQFTEQMNTACHHRWQ